MEWTEFQGMWQQHDVHLAESIRINREILRQVLCSKPERRLRWMKVRAIYGMIIPIPILCIALIPNAKFRDEWDFYLGLILLVTIVAIGIYRAYQYYVLVQEINFTHPVAETKKQLIQLDKFRLKTLNYGFLNFVALPAVILICQIPVNVIFLWISIFIVVFAIGIRYIHSRRFKKQLNDFDIELEKIEQLEKE